VDRSRNQAASGASAVRVVLAVVGAFVVLLAAGIGVAGSAGAQEPPQPTWSMPAEMQPGEQGTVTGEGFQPGATVVMTGPGNVKLGEAVADEFGRISMSMTVPMAMVSGPAMMTIVGTNIAGQVVTLNKSVNIGTLVSASAATPMDANPAFTG
jgi:hypothetical protein